MEVVRAEHDLVDLLEIKGKLDYASASEFDEQLRAVVEDPRRRFILMDFSQVTTLSSPSLRAILSLAKRLKRLSGRLVVAAASQTAEESLRISGFLRLNIFESAPETGAALDGLKAFAAAQPPLPESMLSGTSAAKPAAQELPSEQPAANVNPLLAGGSPSAPAPAAQPKPAASTNPLLGGTSAPAAQPKPAAGTNPLLGGGPSAPAPATEPKPAANTNPLLGGTSTSAPKPPPAKKEAPVEKVAPPLTQEPQAPADAEVDTPGGGVMADVKEALGFWLGKMGLGGAKTSSEPAPGSQGDAAVPPGSGGIGGQVREALRYWKKKVGL